MNNKLLIDELLVQRLIENQFPLWRNLGVRAVQHQGWDNRTFHLGDTMLVRLPSAADYALQVAKEHYWLPKFAPLLPLAIASPIVIGEPQDDYPWQWPIYRYLPGESASIGCIADQCHFAKSLAEFLTALQKIDATNGPVAGSHSFYRGASLTLYDAEVQQVLLILQDKLDVTVVASIWEKALKTPWQNLPVWVHGDISLGNLLVEEGQLTAVIDFGQLAVGDPACDLAIAWTFFKGRSRDRFRHHLQLDADTWNRGRAWALWKALIVAAGMIDPNNAESNSCWEIITEVISDHQADAK